ncbi:MAG: hypothetical protein QXT43_00885 [Candidatus Micrarchaeaceae archaeon]
MRDKALAYALYALALAAFAASIAMRSAVALVIVSVLLLASSVYSGASSFVNAALLSTLFKSKYVMQSQGYALANGGASAVARRGDAYVGISAIRLDVGAGGSNKIGEVISGINSDIDYTVSIRQIDSRRFIEGLAFKRRLKEIELSKNKRSYAKANEIRREIEVLDSEISAVSGSKPVEVSFIVKVFSQGASPGIVSKGSVSAALGIADTISTVAGAYAELLKGEELLGVL